MRRQLLKAGLVLGAQLALGAGPALAQGSDRPIEWVVGFAAGGGSDAVARGVAETWSKSIGRTVIVTNKPGAGTNIAAEYVARSRDLGNVVFTGDFATLAANPTLFSKLGYNAEKDFLPVGLLARFPLFLVVNNQLPVQNFKEFLAWGKANPGQLNYGSPGLGSPHHLATELLAQRVGLKMSHVPYRGGAPAILDVIGGQVPFMLIDSATVVQHMAAGKVRAIGVASAQRLKNYPQIPTLAEQGVSDFEAHAWQGLVAPVGTSPDIIQAWSQALQAALKSPAVLARFDALALEALPGTPAQMQAYWRSERSKWGQVIQTVGIKLD
ncbi:Bug family tripartite tricarboxylate transporter substrate binding protein [Variovorax sp. GB1P17]|uniref:Bug family tripartite tricarboxylate transporter substrate binding protein n=1 Tax=Variovorax sp. GB1P17 TaxID=3443740 RepID=UPI003F48F2B0